MTERNTDPRVWTVIGRDGFSCIVVVLLQSYEVHTLSITNWFSRTSVA